MQQMKKTYNTTDRSSLDKKAYILGHIYYTVLCGGLVFVVLPLVVPMAVYSSSVLRVAVCMLLTSVFGGLLTYRYKRSYEEIILDALLGMGAYTVLTVGKYAIFLCRHILIIMIVIALYKCSVHIRSLRKRKSGNIVRSGIIGALSIFRTCAGGASAAVIVLLPIVIHFTGSEKILNAYYENIGFGEVQTFNDSYEVRPTYGEEYSIRENMETLKYINDDEQFRTLSYEEKCNFVRTLAYTEAYKLGLCKFTLVIEDLDDERGLYDHLRHTMKINAKILRDENESVENLCQTIFEECYHCYEYLMSEVYIRLSPEQRNLYAFTNPNVGAWVHNINHYKEPSVNSIAYLNQPLEEDANAYARSEWTYFYNRVDYYLFLDEYGHLLSN